MPPALDRTSLRLAHLLDHLVSAGEQRLRYGKAEHLRGLDVNDQREFRRLLHRHVCWRGALKDAAGIGEDLAKGVRNIAAVAHQPSGLHAITKPKYRRNG